MKKVKKIVSVLLLVAMMSSLLGVVSFAGDQTTIDQAIADGKFLDFIVMLFSNVDWSSIIKILTQTVNTILNMFGIGR